MLIATLAGCSVQKEIFNNGKWESGQSETYVAAVIIEQKLQEDDMNITS